jgi:hypothetical protein
LTVVHVISEDLGRSSQPGFIRAHDLHVTVLVIHFELRDGTQSTPVECATTAPPQPSPPPTVAKGYSKDNARVEQSRDVIGPIPHSPLIATPARTVKIVIDGTPFNEASNMPILETFSWPPKTAPWPFASVISARRGALSNGWRGEIMAALHVTDNCEATVSADARF